MDFSVTAETVTDGARLPYEVRIRAAQVPPARSVVTLAVPVEFEQTVPTGYEVAVFAQIFQDGGEDVLDSFERLLPTTFDPGTGTITAELPTIAYTDRRGEPGVFEAVIIVTSAPSATPATAAMVVLSAPGGCQAALLRSPVSPLEVTIDQRGAPNMFDPSTEHFGTDYRAANGTEVQAAANGTIRRIGWDERPLDEPDPRSDKMVKGWGRYVEITHDDGTRTLYAHLQEASTSHLRLGQRITAGTVIGKADNTGGSTASHLHLEYRKKDGQKIDSAPCVAAQHIGGQWTGSTSGDVQTTWTWDLFQVGVDVTGTTFAPSQGNITGTVVVNLFYVVIHYPATGALNIGVVAVRGNTLSGTLTLVTSTGFMTSFGNTMTRVSSGVALGAPREEGLQAALGTLNADGTSPASR